MCGVERALDVLRVRARDLAERLAGDGSDVLEVLAAGGFQPLAADEVAVALLEERGRAEFAGVEHVHENLLIAEVGRKENGLKQAPLPLSQEPCHPQAGPMTHKKSRKIMRLKNRSGFSQDRFPARPAVRITTVAVASCDSRQAHRMLRHCPKMKQRPMTREAERRRRSCRTEKSQADAPMPG